MTAVHASDWARQARALAEDATLEETTGAKVCLLEDARRRCPARAQTPCSNVPQRDCAARVSLSQLPARCRPPPSPSPSPRSLPGVALACGAASRVGLTCRLRLWSAGAVGEALNLAHLRWSERSQSALALPSRRSSWTSAGWVAGSLLSPAHSHRWARVAPARLTRSSTRATATSTLACRCSRARCATPSSSVPPQSSSTRPCSPQTGNRSSGEWRNGSRSRRSVSSGASPSPAHSRHSPPLTPSGALD